MDIGITKRKTSKKWCFFLRAVQFAILNGFVQPESVPDTKGTQFFFTTPLCSYNFPAKMHVIPQSTNLINVTLVHIDSNHLGNQIDELYRLQPDDSLHLELLCVEFRWGRTITTGFYLEATSDVSVYIDTIDDSYIVFPWDIIGHNYIVSSLTTIELADSFVILHGNQSHVELTLPPGHVVNVTINGQQYTGGSTVNISLPEYGVLGIRCTCDLTGATIVSTLPVSVYIGAIGRNLFSGLIEQLPAKETFGRKFLYPVSSRLAQNLTLKISGQSLNTEITITTKGTTLQRSFQTLPTLSVWILVRDFLSVEANTSVLCLIVCENIDESDGRHMALSFLVPTELFHISSTLIFQTKDYFSANFVITLSSFQYIAFNNTNNRPFQRALTYLWNFFISDDNILQQPYIMKTSDKNIVPFLANVLRKNNYSAYEYPLSMRMTSIYGACVKTPIYNGGNGDGVDNDCDNQIDEEIFNNLDDDNDGLIDEDTVYSGILQKTSVESPWEYHVTHKEPDNSSTNSVISVAISFSVAVTAVVLFIGGMLLAEKVRRSGSTTRVTPLCT